MSGFHAPGATSHDPMPGTRRVNRNGYPLTDSLMVATALFLFAVCYGVFNQLYLSLAVLAVFLVLMILRGSVHRAYSYDINLAEPRKTTFGYVLLYLSVAGLLFLVMPQVVTGLPAVLVAAVCSGLNFLALYRYLPCTSVEAPAGQKPDLATLAKPWQKERLR